MSRLNVSRLMEIEDPAVLINVQSGALDRKLDDKRVVVLIREPLTSHYGPCSAKAPPLLSNSAAEIAILAVASIGPNAGPKAKENGRYDHERDHHCVPQSHSAQQTLLMSFCDAERDLFRARLVFPFPALRHLVPNTGHF
jgi:hypothetical protein